jgi:N-acetyl-gamma-glutamyl-phosphate reductase
MNETSNIRKPSVGIIGASGYTGSELVRILSHHPGISLEAITSESHAGKKISDVHPYLLDVCDRTLIPSKVVEDMDFDLVFLALPHGVSMKFVKEHRDRDFRIVDLSGDFRLSSGAVYKEWYQIEHECPRLLGDAVFGLPELFRKDIISASLVANPGCYPTSAILPLAPLLAEGLISPEDIIIDSKSGVSGAGAKAKPVTHFPSVNEDFRAYGIACHRHTPEIEEALSRIGRGSIKVNFTPHLTPLNRGILTTIYCKPVEAVKMEDLDSVCARLYSTEPFIRIRDTPPSVQAVRGSNFCDIHMQLDPRTDRIIVTSVIDNLVKGAAGQAVQNMNIMLGFREEVGLESPPLAP